MGDTSIFGTNRVGIEPSYLHWTTQEKPICNNSSFFDRQSRIKSTSRLIPPWQGNRQNDASSYADSQTLETISRETLMNVQQAPLEESILAHPAWISRSSNLPAPEVLIPTLHQSNETQLIHFQDETSFPRRELPVDHVDQCSKCTSMKISANWNPKIPKRCYQREQAPKTNKYL
jgi:hypothetical protein